MALLAGYTVVTYANTPDTSNRVAEVLDELSPFDWPPAPHSAGEQTIEGESSFPLVSSSPLKLTRRRGRGGHTVVEGVRSIDVYNTIHVLPPLIELGNLLSSQDLDFEVWNAYFIDQSLASIGTDGVDGLSLTEPFVPPTDFGPLESRIYTLSVSTSGPSVIDGSYTFNFPSDAPVLRVTGVRVIVFPFKPNWARPVSERLEWLTDVMGHLDGSEQRIALRQKPRQTYEYRTSNSGLDKQRLNAMLWDWQARIFAVPIWQDGGSLQSSASPGDTSLSINTDDLDYKVGGLVVLYQDTATYEAVEVLTVNSTSVDLATELSGTWPAGTSVYPARLYRIDDSLSFVNETVKRSDGVVRFRAESLFNETSDEFAATYRGLPILDRPPNAVSKISSDIQRDMDILDSLTGIAAFDDRTNYPTTIQDYNWLLEGRANITFLRQWLFARQGRLTPFWSPSWTDDLTLSEDIQDVDTQIKIYFIGYAEFMSGDINRKDIKILLKDGSVFYRRVTGAVNNGDGTESLVIDSALGQLVGVSDVDLISFMYLARLDSDQIELSWRFDDFVECSHRVRGLNYDV